MAINITTNNVPRDVVYRCELSAKESADFDYLAPDEGTFFRYRGEVYYLGEFMLCPSDSESVGNVANNVPGWHGYQSNSFFSGIVIRYVDNYERVIVGRYYS